jgi:hypothetical protein
MWFTIFTASSSTVLRSLSIVWRQVLVDGARTDCSNKTAPTLHRRHYPCRLSCRCASPTSAHIDTLMSCSVIQLLMALRIYSPVARLSRDLLNSAVPLFYPGTCNVHIPVITATPTRLFLRQFSTKSKGGYESQKYFFLYLLTNIKWEVFQYY